MSFIFENKDILKISEQDEMIALSNSMAILLGSYQEALIVQKLHSWILEGQGIVIDGERWFDKSIEDWIIKILPTTSRKMRSHMSSLVKKGVLQQKQFDEKHHADNNLTKKRTYYYRLDYERLSELESVAIAAQNSNNAGGGK